MSENKDGNLLSLRVYTTGLTSVLKNYRCTTVILPDNLNVTVIERFYFYSQTRPSPLFFTLTTTQNPLVRYSFTTVPSHTVVESKSGFRQSGRGLQTLRLYLKVIGRRFPVSMWFT